MSTAMVLAGPERKRILRELLGVPEPWTLTHRKLYGEMLRWEWEATAGGDCDVEIAEDIGAKAFAQLVSPSGMVETPRLQAK